MKKFLKRPLTREITVVLLIKFLLIFVLWWAFFSQPMDRSLTPEQVSRALLSQQPVNTSQQKE